MKTMVNWLPNAGKYHIAGRGDVYYGPAPFNADKTKEEDMERFFKMPWVISHPDAKDKLYRCKGVESYALQWIREGAPIGLLVEEMAPTDEIAPPL